MLRRAEISVMSNSRTLMGGALAGLTACLMAAQAFAADQQINACDLLEPAEVTKALGHKVGNGERRDQGMQNNGAYSSSCIWTIEDKNATTDPSKPFGGRSFVILNVMQWPTGSDQARTFLDSFRQAADHGVIPSQPDSRKFGDEALWWGDGLAVVKDHRSFGLSVFMPGLQVKKPGEIEEKMAPHVLRRMARL